jgi:hypothetical protein
VKGEIPNDSVFVQKREGVIISNRHKNE